MDVSMSHLLYKTQESKKTGQEKGLELDSEL